MPTVITLDEMERLVRAALEAGDTAALRAALVEEHPADIADVIDRLDDDEQLIVFRALPTQLAAEVLSETALEATRELVRRLPPEDVGDLLDLMPPDDVAEILGEDVPESQQTLLAEMEPEEAAEVRTLLTYPLRSAGRIMTERFAAVTPAMTAGDVIPHLRQIDPDIETIQDLYVLDPAGTLLGKVALRSVIIAPPEQRLDQIMNIEPVTVTPDTDQEEVARLVSQYDLVTLPVISTSGRLLGIITVDDVIDVLVQESTEDVLRFGAVEGGATDESYFSTPIARAVRRRIGWLLILFLTGTLTINVLGRFEEELDQVVALAFFIPLLIGTGGNTGAQTVSTMVRAMALGEIRLRDAWDVVLRELTSGLLLGSLLSVVAFGFAYILGGSLQLALVVALSIIAVCTWANTIGALVPLIAQKLGLDPALVSAPLITTLVDATGLAIYLLIAKALLGL
jgi:magnesium transporter